MLKTFMLKRRAYRKILHAFTMVEIIVALAILSTSMLAVFGVLSMCSRANGNSQRLTESVLLAESLLSEAMLENPVAYQTTKGQQGLFNWQVQTAPTEMDNLAAVSVQVTWLQQHRPQEYKLLSLRYLPATLQGN
jgi:type II secretory pathway pseudopilin PulG